MDAAWIGLVGTAVGAAITQLATWISRRQDRAARERETLLKMAEELASITAELTQWQMNSFRAAVEGKNDLPPWILLRLETLVSVYFPDLRALSRELHHAVSQVQDSCGTLAESVRRLPDVLRPPDLHESVKSAMQSLTIACVKMTEAIGEQMKHVRNA